MACLNITCLLRHIDELRIIFHSKCLDLLAINETWLHDIIADNEVSVDGYDIVCRDRLLNSRNGGGVCFYIHSNINYDVRKDLIFDQLESLSIKISKPRSYMVQTSQFTFWIILWFWILLGSLMLKEKSPVGDSEFFLCPTLMSCWLIHLHISLPSLKFTIFINLSLLTMTSIVLILAVCRTPVIYELS